MASETQGTRLRVRGKVQGVGFRPHVAKLARAQGLRGWVRNDAHGVEIALVTSDAEVARFKETLLATLPPLARVDAIESEALLALQGQEDAGDGDSSLAAFRILESHAVLGGMVRTDVTPDAATCAACAEEVRSPYERRFRYPFTNCTHCGPRYSIITGIPYDRENTTMKGFPLCVECQRDYQDDGDRRYHAQPIACHVCGPKAWLERADGRAFTYDRYSPLDMVDAVAGVVTAGHIVAVKGVGGFHLICDATNDAAVNELRKRKCRDGKPFALMAKDVDVIRAHAHVSELEARALASAAAPIVLLSRIAAGEAPEVGPGVSRKIAPGVAPGMGMLGFMLPSNPLHALFTRRLDRRPVVCTSGNLSDEPPAIDNDDARARLAPLCDWFLFHDRPIARRLDDSVAREMGGAVRVLRRSRGYVPEPLPAPEGFAEAPPVLALGAQLKSTVCLLDQGRAIPSQHFGDLDLADAFADYQRGLQHLSALFEHQPKVYAVDMHPEYRPTMLGLDLARQHQHEAIPVQHHHAHVAACMFEHGHPIHGPAVLGIAFDGLGYGEGGELWGGEFLLASYTAFERVGTLRPVALLGGDLASHEPWRNLYAHLMAQMGWAEVAMNFGDLEITQRLAEKPRATLDAMLLRGSHAPLASSAGRLFDAVAAALGLHFDRVDFEGQAAMELEALVTEDALAEARQSELYPIGIPKLPGTTLPYLEPLGMWRGILGDLFEGTRPELIAARFHLSLADAIRRMAALAKKREPLLGTAVLSGGVFQNKVLLESTTAALSSEGFAVWTHTLLPPNDGCISVGQAAVAAARAMSRVRKE
jgi:hydrogenase maturation protein HypF